MRLAPKCMAIAAATVGTTIPPIWTPLADWRDIGRRDSRPRVRVHDRRVGTKGDRDSPGGQRPHGVEMRQQVGVDGTAVSLAVVVQKPGIGHHHGAALSHQVQDVRRALAAVLDAVLRPAAVDGRDERSFLDRQRGGDNGVPLYRVDRHRKPSS